MRFKFIVNNRYSRRDIYNQIGISEDTHGGVWDTGYARFNNDWFIFANVGIPGRTGHNYDNIFIEKDLLWRGKTNSHIKQKSIQSMIHPIGDIYIFTRNNDRADFTFAGLGKAKEINDTIPVTILWELVDNFQIRYATLPEEFSTTENIYEGALKKIYVNSYERSPLAREICINNYGPRCIVCGFDFEKIYGAIGKGFIHVHHLTAIHEIGEVYLIDPINDLNPVCPNCHAIIHRREPPYSIDEVRALIHEQRSA